MTNLNSVTDDRLDAAVRRLDPAATAGPGLSAAEQHRADDLRARILSTGPNENVLGRPPQDPTPTRGRPGLRWVLAGGAVVAVTAGLLAIPRFGAEQGDDRPTAPAAPAASTSHSASAVVPAAPTTALSDVAQNLGDKCATDLKKFASRPPSQAVGSFSAAQLDSMHTILGERHGAYDIVVLGNDAGYDAQCMYQVGGTEPSAKGGINPLETPSPSSVSVSLAGEITEGIVDGKFERKSGAALYGRVGSQVVGVSVRNFRGEVATTVRDGWFAAAWTDLEQDPSHEKATVTLTLADGTKVGPTPFSDLAERSIPDTLFYPAG
ncbi:hypothetical protein [Knoellia subterranea]|uniref:Uncharacterized protein n=1 Tax=Knoellia subterranea KCTC 19937 TaxID=1385521 RepID=A0A0A0JKK0_9MICO|nr:hypothetical protein [Knoellia subterranea]KGN36171.1 hypothetical protein N803_06195 [Knoellia subterranea KCTC 19937]